MCSIRIFFPFLRLYRSIVFNFKKFLKKKSTSVIHSKNVDDTLKHMINNINVDDALKDVIFSEDFNEPVGHVGCNNKKCPKNLLNSTTKLTFGNLFNQPMRLLPNSITHLTFGNEFNQQVNKLPKKLTYLTFGKNFNQNVDYLPNNITHIIFGEFFNQQVDSLPTNLIHLTFGECFNQLVDSLPNNLVHLTFGKNFNRLVNNLSNSITHLTFGDNFNQKVNNLPKSITHLKFGVNFNQQVNNLPNLITHLTLGEKFNKQVNNLPNSIAQLEIYSIMYDKLITKYPISLTEITFRNISVIKNNIPDSVNCINILFDDLQSLSSNKSADFDLSNIPANIKQIRINDKDKLKYITKIPFGCIITDFKNNIIDMPNH